MMNIKKTSKRNDSIQIYDLGAKIRINRIEELQKINPQV